MSDSKRIHVSRSPARALPLIGLTGTLVSPRLQGMTIDVVYIGTPKVPDGHEGPGDQPPRGLLLGIAALAS